MRLWKHIRKGWGSFSSHIRLSMGYGNRISFWHYVWVGDTALEDAYPSIFRIAREHDALVADLREITNGSQQWNVSFIREAHDWEVGVFVEFLICYTPLELMIQWRISLFGLLLVKETFMYTLSMRFSLLKLVITFLRRAFGGVKCLLRLLFLFGLHP